MKLTDLYHVPAERIVRCSDHPNVGYSLMTSRVSGWCDILPCGLCLEALHNDFGCTHGQEVFTPDCDNCKCKFICLTIDLEDTRTSDKAEEVTKMIWKVYESR